MQGDGFGAAEATLQRVLRGDVPFVTLLCVGFRSQSGRDLTDTILRAVASYKNESRTKHYFGLVLWSGLLTLGECNVPCNVHVWYV